MSRVVSAKIPDELKKKADKYEIRIEKLLRDALSKNKCHGRPNPFLKTR